MAIKLRLFIVLGCLLISTKAFPTLAPESENVDLVRVDSEIEQETTDRVESKKQETREENVESEIIVTNTEEIQMTEKSQNEQDDCTKIVGQQKEIIENFQKNLEKQKVATTTMLKSLEEQYKTNENRLKVNIVKLNEKMAEMEEMRRKENEESLRQKWELRLMEDQERRQRTEYWEMKMKEETRKLFLDQLEHMQNDFEKRRDEFTKLFSHIVPNPKNENELTTRLTE